MNLKCTDIILKGRCCQPTLSCLPTAQSSATQFKVSRAVHTHAASAFYCFAPAHRNRTLGSYTFPRNRPCGNVCQGNKKNFLVPLRLSPAAACPTPTPLEPLDQNLKPFLTKNLFLQTKTMQAQPTAVVAQPNVAAIPSGMFRDDVFGCFGDCNSCLLACCCPCISFANIQSQIQGNTIVIGRQEWAANCCVYFLGAALGGVGAYMTCSNQSNNLSCCGPSLVSNRSARSRAALLLELDRIFTIALVFALQHPLPGCLIISPRAL